MKNTFILLFIILISSCDTLEEIYLYDSNDPEYSILKTMAVQACIDQASIFSALDNFENSDLTGNIYKIVQDKGNQANIYAYIQSVSSTEMVIVFNSELDDDLDKVITFEVGDHNDLLTELQTMACNEEYSGFFTTTGLDSTDSMTLNWEKETVSIADSDDDGVDEAYVKRTDKYTISTSYPLFFLFYNGTKTETMKVDGSEEGEAVTSTLTITDVTDEEECDSSSDSYNSSCSFSGISLACGITVNTGLYATNGASDEFISYDGTGCNRLASGKN